MTKSKMQIILFDTYIFRIKKAVGSKMFQNLFMQTDGKKADILKNGNLSCAMFASSILYLCKLISGPHAMVPSTLEDMKQNGWFEIKKPKLGAVLIWEPQKSKDGMHTHIGFYIGNNKAISNDFKKKSPQIHHYTMNNTRKLTGIYWNKKLN